MSDVSAFFIASVLAAAYAPWYVWLPFVLALMWSIAMELPQVPERFWIWVGSAILGAAMGSGLVLLVEWVT